MYEGGLTVGERDRIGIGQLQSVWVKPISPVTKDSWHQGRFVLHYSTLLLAALNGR